MDYQLEYHMVLMLNVNRKRKKNILRKILKFLEENVNIKWNINFISKFFSVVVNGYNQSGPSGEIKTVWLVALVFLPSLLGIGIWTVLCHTLLPGNKPVQFGEHLIDLDPVL